MGEPVQLPDACAKNPAKACGAKAACGPSMSSAASGSQAATQDHCATSAGNASNGVRVGYDFNRDISFLPDAWVANLNWSCDNSIFWKSFSSSNSGSFYMAIASTPGWVWSDGRVNYNK
ncbi:hypothetical protein ABZ128_28755 [Streptomyces sp. NPDC006326]|uniref:hypothetical protein n=1 Tax=Streptomyces sp. NPDC006326 TaxID=3156752 RepID=UPI0033A7D2AC